MFQHPLISDFGISVISKISNRISGRLYEVWQQLVTPRYEACTHVNKALNMEPRMLRDETSEIRKLFMNNVDD